MKHKIDNRATCKKLIHAYINEKIKCARHARAILKEMVDRTGYGKLKSSGKLYWKDTGLPYKLFYETVTLSYPNTYIEVFVGYGRQEKSDIELFEVTWYGRNSKIKFNESYS